MRRMFVFLTKRPASVIEMYSGALRFDVVSDSGVKTALLSVKMEGLPR